MKIKNINQYMFFQNLYIFLKEKIILKFYV